MKPLPLMIKPGVRLLGLRPETMLGITVVFATYQHFGYQCVLTSVCDGRHSAGSLHYQGAAFDVRIWTVPPDRRQEVAGACREALGADFDVVLESDHLHVEYQPKGP